LPETEPGDIGHTIIHRNEHVDDGVEVVELGIGIIDEEELLPGALL
jgi:hypothetical protein